MAELTDDELIASLRQKFGDSTDESRKAIIEAAGEIDNLERFALLWWSYSMKRLPELLMCDPAYVTAVYCGILDLGYRMGLKGAAKVAPVN